MTDNSNRSDPAKKVYTLSLSGKETETELSLIFDRHTCAECEQDHSFKNSFPALETSIDYLPAYLRHRISIVISVEGGIGI
jgi:hypothetical protein